MMLFVAFVLGFFSFPALSLVICVYLDVAGKNEEERIKILIRESNNESSKS